MKIECTIELSRDAKYINLLEINSSNGWICLGSLLYLYWDGDTFDWDFLYLNTAYRAIKYWLKERE